MRTVSSAAFALISANSLRCSRFGSPLIALRSKASPTGAAHNASKNHPSHGLLLLHLMLQSLHPLPGLEFPGPDSCLWLNARN